MADWKESIVANFENIKGAGELKETYILQDRAG